MGKQTVYNLYIIHLSNMKLYNDISSRVWLEQLTIHPPTNINTLLITTTPALTIYLCLT